MTARAVALAVIGAGVALAGAGVAWWAAARLSEALALLAALATVGG